MNRFLQESIKVYNHLVADPFYYRKVRVVMGNESCDLDSAISALVYAYILYHENKQKGVRNYEILPILNINHEDFVLKTEVVFYLKLHNIALELVPTRGKREVFSLAKLAQAGVLDLTLVDHHTLPPYDQEAIPAVVEVIDHRPQDPMWSWPNAQVNIKPVGSCSSLIGQMVLQRCPHLLTFQICYLLYGPILLDTFNLSEEAGRVTTTDTQVIQALERKVNVDRKKMFEDLLYAKADVAELSNVQILRKDLKVLTGLPVAGLPMLVQEFHERVPQLDETLTAFTRARSVPAMVLMGVKVLGDGVRKDIAVFSTNGSVLGKLAEALKAFDAPSLNLVEVNRPNLRFTKVFKQGNITMSRKQIGPILNRAAAGINEISRRGSHN